jgi:hypothetical protein
MPLTTEERDILIETATIVKRLEETMNSETGTPRCAKHIADVENVKRSLTNLKGIVTTAGITIFSVLLYAILK